MADPRLGQEMSERNVEHLFRKARKQSTGNKAMSESSRTNLKGLSFWVSDQCYDESKHIKYISIHEFIMILKFQNLFRYHQVIALKIDKWKESSIYHAILKVILFQSNQVQLGESSYRRIPANQCMRINEIEKCHHFATLNDNKS